MVMGWWWGEHVVGYKIGCVSTINQQTLGLPHPVWGNLWSTEQYADGVQLRKADFANIAIEVEFAVTIKSAIDQHNITADDVVRAVDSALPVLELHHLVLRSDPPHGHELIASNAIHAGVVRGTSTLALSTVTETDLALIYDGAVIDSWSAIQWPHAVLGAIVWLAKALAEHGKRIEAGDTILTGALGPRIAVNAATSVSVTSSAFGQVGATFI